MNFALWWQMPGPARYIERVLNHLRQGYHAILLLPEHGPQQHGLLDALKRAWRDEGGVDILQSFPDKKPLQSLAEQYGLPPDCWQSAKKLLESRRLQGRVIYIQGLDPTSWVFWSAFLDEFQHLTRNMSLLERILFIAPLVGKATKVSFKPEAGLSMLQWDGIVESADMLLFTAFLVKERKFPQRLSWTLITSIAEVSAFDPEVASLLAREPEQTILAPREILQNMCMKRGWTSDTGREWSAGTIMKFNGSHTVHPALAALQDGIDRHLWRAHVATVFPIIEEHRISFINKYKKYFSVPFETIYGTVNNHENLELGHILHQVKAKKIPITKAELSFIKELKNARDKLAHLQPISSSKLLRGSLIYGPS